MIAGLYIAVVVIGYLFGSIPFGLIIGKLFAKKDVRQIGSGKTGMTNVIRTAGKTAGGISLLLDMGKAVAAVLLAGLIFRSYDTIAVVPFNHYYSAQALAALAAIAGHSWSVFLKFKGGRGVATFVGGLLAMYWPAAVVGGGLMIIIGLVSKYMSLGSITGAVAAFIMLTILNIMQIDFLSPTYPAFEYVVYAMIGAIFIYAMHRDNIIRLVSGTERRIDDKSKAETAPTSGNTE